MPPKVRVSKEDILRATLEIIRQGGEDAVNARSIADALECSTQPIFREFSSIDELVSQTKKVAYSTYIGFIENEVASEKYPAYKAFGMAYIRFAKEEKELFKLLFMCDRTGSADVSSEDFEKSVEMIMSTNGFSREKAERMHLEMWSAVHGIGVMMATSFLELDFNIVSGMLSDMYHGLRTVHATQEAKA